MKIKTSITLLYRNFKKIHGCNFLKFTRSSKICQGWHILSEEILKEIDSLQGKKKNPSAFLEQAAAIFLDTIRKRRRGYDEKLSERIVV